ncbi:hypothetical protein BSKO_12119 [Bryopsis sp. KO-2023]|nr:hypothetical protein BSKO_12119 [Bryopsis sp. KO-2023]
MANRLTRSLRRVAAFSISDTRISSARVVWPCVSLVEFRGADLRGRKTSRCFGGGWRLEGWSEFHSCCFSTASGARLRPNHLDEFEKLRKTGAFQKSTWDACAHRAMESLQEIDPLEISAIVECCSKAKYLNEGFLVGLTHRLLSLEEGDLSVFDGSEIGGLIKALGILAVQCFEGNAGGLTKSTHHPDQQAFFSTCDALLGRIVDDALARDVFSSNPPSFGPGIYADVLHGFGLLASVEAFRVTGEVRQLAGVVLGELSKGGNLDQLTPLQLSDILWACGVMKYKHFAVFRRVFQLLGSTLGAESNSQSSRNGLDPIDEDVTDRNASDGFSGVVISQLVWAMGSMQFKDTPLLPLLKREVLVKVEGFGSKEVWMALDGLFKLEHNASDVVDSLVKRASNSEVLMGFLNEELTSILHFLARWSYHNAVVFDAFWGEISHPKRMASLEDGQLVDIMESFVQLGYRKASVWRGLGEEVVNGGRARNLPNPRFACMLVCFGKASHRHDSMLREVSSMLMAGDWLGGFDDQDFVNVVYGLALMGFRDGKVLQVLASQAVNPHRLIRYEGQHLSALMYAFARLEYRNKDLLDTLMWEISKEGRLGNFTEHQLANVLWGCGKIKYFNEGPVGAVVQEASLNKRLEMYTEQGLSNIVYCLGRLNYRQPDVLNRLGKEVGMSHRMAKFSPQALSNITFAFGKLDFEHKKLLKSLEFALTQPDRLLTFNELELSNLMFGLGKLSFGHRRSVEILETEVCREDRLKRCTCPDLCNIAYGLSGMRCFLEPAIEAFLEEVLKPERLKGFSDKELQMVVTKLDEIPCVQAEPLEILAKECTARFDAAQDWDYPIFRPLGERLMFHPPYPQNDATEQEVGELLFKYVKLKQAEEEAQQDGRPIWGKLLV